jgi:hypothetical protein
MQHAKKNHTVQQIIFKQTDDSKNQRHNISFNTFYILIQTMKCTSTLLTYCIRLAVHWVSNQVKYLRPKNKTEGDKEFTDKPNKWKCKKKN